MHSLWALLVLQHELKLRCLKTNNSVLFIPLQLHVILSFAASEHTLTFGKSSGSIIYHQFFFYMALQPNHGLWPPHSRGFRDHTHDAPHSIGLLWTSDQTVAETSTWQHTTLTTDKHPCHRWDSNSRSQQASGRRPTPWTARPLGPAHHQVIGWKILSCCSHCIAFCRDFRTNSNLYLV
jgi:hypothetical protein